MSERERLLKRIAAVDFAIVEFHIFLDTHPYSEEIEKKLIQYREKSALLRAEYEEKFGPISANSVEANQWAWIANPWPWDNEEAN